MVNRFLESKAPADASAVTQYLDEVEPFATSIPTSIDVGYFQTTPTPGGRGFVFTQYDSFPLS